MNNYTYQHDPRISGADFEADDYDPDDDCRTHALDCECEDCMQTYPERFDEDWNNTHRIEV